MKNNTTPLYIIGAGGLGREAAWLIERINKVVPVWNFKGFIDDNDLLWGTRVGGYPVLGGCEYLTDQSNPYCVCAVGGAKTRRNIIRKINGKVNFATLIDPSVIISERVSIGEGTLICAKNYITVEISIGKHNIINSGCTIGHDVMLEDYVTLYPGVNISGSVYVEECVELGTGVQVIQGKKIGTETIIGAGAVVVKDLMAKCTAVGVPARPVKFHG